MSADFHMQYHHNKDNLHVRMRGVFDGSSAHELLNLLLKEYRCGGRVFVDTAELRDIVPFGGKVLQARLCKTPVPAAQLFFKGENGFQIAPSGSRVLIVPQRKKKTGCCGKCKQCTCGGKCGGHHHEHHDHHHEH